TGQEAGARAEISAIAAPVSNLSGAGEGRRRWTAVLALSIAAANRTGSHPELSAEILSGGAGSLRAGGREARRETRYAQVRQTQRPTHHYAIDHPQEPCAASA